MFYTNTSQPI